MKIKFITVRFFYLKDLYKNNKLYKKERLV